MPTLTSAVSAISPSAERLDQGLAHLAATVSASPPAAADQEQRELVAAEAGEQVAVAQVLGQPDADVRQQLVADVVTEAVVDLLELVHVEQQQRAGTPSSSRASTAA